MPTTNRRHAAPLWSRVVSGQAFAWRLRSLRNKARSRVRRLARRLSRRSLLRANRQLSTALRSPRTTYRSVRRRLRGEPIVPSGALPRARFPAKLPLVVALHDVANDLPLLELVDTSSTALRADLLLGRGAPVVDGTSNRLPGVWLAESSGLVSVTDAGGTGPRVVPAVRDPVDIARWNPVGTPQARFGPALTLADCARDSAVARRARQAIHVDVSVDHGLPVHDLAATVARLACSGAVLAGPGLRADVRDLLATEVVDLIESVDRSSFTTDRLRELYSVRLRRAALRTHSDIAWWTSVAGALGMHERAVPSVTVLLASNRADDVLGAVEQIGAQRHQRVQLVVGLHALEFAAATEAAIRERFRGPLVVQHHAAEDNLGDVLISLSARADGELVTKWDDDDWYGVEHLGDLIDALRYSGADLVGRAAEFVHLGSIDLTIRRFPKGAETWSHTVAGGTLMVPRDVLVAVGGWTSAPRRVDRLLIERIAAAGGRVYRTNGFGYVRRRSAHGRHTWTVEDGQFLRQSVDQRRGLDLEFAGVDR
jgi:hypothetical protein